MNPFFSNLKPNTKKRKTDDGDVADVSGSKVYVLPYGSVPCNSHIKEVTAIVKPLFIAMMEHINTVGETPWKLATVHINTVG